MIWRILAPWLITLAFAAGGFVVSLRQDRILRAPRFYLAYFALAGVTQLGCMLMHSNHYDTVFWICELLHNSLLCFVSIEVICSLLPPRSATLWAFSFMTILIVSVGQVMPTIREDILLNLSTTACYIGGILLVVLLFSKVRWIREYELVTAGVLAVLVGDFFSSRQVLSGMSTSSVLAIQLAPTPGLILLALAGYSKLKP